jgi:hypothetical protein
LTFHPEAASRRPARARGVCAGLVGSWWAQVPTRRLQTFVGGFQRVFLHSPEVVFIDNTQVEGKSLPVWPDSGAEGAYRICKLDHGSIHAMLKDFPTEPELRRTMQRLVAGALPEVPCYYWVLTYLPGLANGPGCLGKDLSELRTVVERV